MTGADWIVIVLAVLMIMLVFVVDVRMRRSAAVREAERLRLLREIRRMP